MLLGMTASEWGLVLFIFALVWVAALVPRAGAFVGRRLAGRAGGPRGEDKSRARTPT